MKIFLGADHRGFELKEKLKSWLIDVGYDVSDLGNTIYDKEDDFTDFAFAVGDRVSQDNESRGIVICASAGGVEIAANKVKGVRASGAWNMDEIKHNRSNDDINVLAIPAEYIEETAAKEMIIAFLNTAFDPQERYLRRLKKIEEWERAE